MGTDRTSTTRQGAMPRRTFLTMCVGSVAVFACGGGDEAPPESASPGALEPEPERPALPAETLADPPTESGLEVTLYDRQGCIDCGACWQLCPEVFERGPEGIVRFTEAYATRPEEGSYWNATVPLHLEACVMEAVSACPVPYVLISVTPA